MDSTLAALQTYFRQEWPAEKSRVENNFQVDHEKIRLNIFQVTSIDLPITVDFFEIYTLEKVTW